MAVYLVPVKRLADIGQHQIGHARAVIVSDFVEHSGNLRPFQVINADFADLRLYQSIELGLDHAGAAEIARLDVAGDVAVEQTGNVPLGRLVCRPAGAGCDRGADPRGGRS